MIRLQHKNINKPDYIKEFTAPDEFLDEVRLKALARNYTGGTFVDVGCYDSFLANWIKEQYPDERVIAIDHSPTVVKKMQAKFPEVEYICDDCFNIPECEYVVAGELLEHLDNPQEFIELMKKKAKKIAISVPYNEVNNPPVSKEEHLWSFTEQDFEGWETEIIEHRLCAWYEN